MKICTADPCDREVLWAGLCQTHYKRRRKWGDPRADLPIKPARHYRRTAKDAFESYMGKLEQTDECIHWRGPIAKRGYGSLSFGGSANRILKRAHRVSYELFNGQLADDEVVRHTCDNPPCVNPRHLIAGTPADNIRDKVLRNRQSRGTDRYNAKLDEDRVREIRKLYDQGVSQKNLAERYSVSTHAIHSVVHRRSWKHVG